MALGVHCIKKVGNHIDNRQLKLWPIKSITIYRCPNMQYKKEKEKEEKTSFSPEASPTKDFPTCQKSLRRWRKGSKWDFLKSCQLATRVVQRACVFRSGPERFKLHTCKAFHRLTHYNFAPLPSSFEPFLSSVQLYTLAVYWITAAVALPFEKFQIIVMIWCCVICHNTFCFGLCKKSKYANVVFLILFRKLRFAFPAALSVCAKFSPHGGRVKRHYLSDIQDFHARSKLSLIILLLFFNKPLPTVHPPGKVVTPWEVFFILFQRALIVLRKRKRNNGL